MLVEMAVADAYGIAFEFVRDYEKHGLRNDLTFQQNPRYLDLKPSMYTDDTLRSIATANVIIGPESKFDVLSYVDALQQEYKRDKRKGWSKRFQGYLDESEARRDKPFEFVRGIKNRAESNGSIMGCLPCGYLANTVDVRLAAAVQAIATHSAMTVPYAQAMALAAHYFIYEQGPVSELEDFLREEVEGFESAFGDEKPVPVDMSARQTAHAVLLLVDQGQSLSGIMEEAVNIGGDTDSVAALAVGIASCSVEFRNDIPRALIGDLDEGGPFGSNYLKGIDDALAAFAFAETV